MWTLAPRGINLTLQFAQCCTLHIEHLRTARRWNHRYVYIVIELIALGELLLLNELEHYPQP